MVSEAVNKDPISSDRFRLDLMQMQGLGDDDMVDGDLGDGMGGKKAPSSTRKKSQSARRSSEPQLPGAEDAASIPGLKITEEQRARWTAPCCGSLLDLSKDELKDRLKAASEVIDALCCELDVAHRYLEGKYEALKILQGKAILDKATGHTKSLLQKSEERAKELEKEVNSLQWEISFKQVQMKRSDQTWEQKYSRILSENKSLSDSLKEREQETLQLRAENAAQRRQSQELLSMLSVKERRLYQGTAPPSGPDRDASVLELDAQRLRREEALTVADAFRIAFEQQLKKRSEHLLLLAEANALKCHQGKGDGLNRSPSMSVGQRLRALLPSSLDVNMSADLLVTLDRLLDLLNDKEEALAHQRKVSIMLARSAEQLQRQLHLESHQRPSSLLPEPPHGATQPRSLSAAGPPARQHTELPHPQLQPQHEPSDRSRAAGQTPCCQESHES
ncbi:coiled-coil domain-containing protein 125 isoform X3 [Betta splendens]|uniref:Coiled-coil domain-containing protein 125 isoform X3 n=1 Tax=Betta splendens TaxID=158456 RepID=A0A6P7L9W8_BETSP|nr:coiled-coil domain-containing protein 125 isoform X3 [Betta splendens]